MALDALSLLSGPRGRRVCLELAPTLAEEESARTELASAIPSAAFELDPGRGASRGMLIAMRREGDEPAAAPVRPASPTQVASLLAGTRYREPADGDLLEAVRTSVDRALYWQPPDGEDVLAALREVQQALTPVAALVASSPLATGWSAPMDPGDQWCVEFPALSRPGRSPGFASSTELARWRAAMAVDEERARRDRPADIHLNYSGAWWSVPPHLLRRTTSRWGDAGPAGVHLIEDRLSDSAGVATPVRVYGTPNVYEVDRPERWAELCRRYPLEVTASRRHDWFRTTGREGRWVLPDWSRVAADFDAVHVNLAGYLTSAGRAVEVTEELASVLAGWNPDETVWLRDGFVRPERR